MSVDVDPLEFACQIIQDKFYFLTFLDKGIKSIPHIHYFSTDEQFVYRNFHHDFGPLNLSCVTKYCRLVSKKIEAFRTKGKVLCHVTSQDLKKRTNAAFLVGCFCVLVAGKTPEETVKCLISQPNQPLFVPFRDVNTGPSLYNLGLLDCFKSLVKSSLLGIYNVDTFNLEESDHLEELGNGDMNWIVPRKFLAFPGPQSPSYNSNDNFPNRTPEFYLNYFLKSDISTVVRLNKELYPEKVFQDAGLDHYDLYFPDGTVPSLDIVGKFMEISDKAVGSVAVHCKAGLGRTGTLIGCYMMKTYKFSAAECISWVRMARPGSVIGMQQIFLNDIEKFLFRPEDSELLQPKLLAFQNNVQKQFDNCNNQQQQSSMQLPHIQLPFTTKLQRQQQLHQQQKHQQHWQQQQQIQFREALSPSKVSEDVVMLGEVKALVYNPHPQHQQHQPKQQQQQQQQQKQQQQLEVKQLNSISSRNSPLPFYSNKKDDGPNNIKIYKSQQAPQQQLQKLPPQQLQKLPQQQLQKLPQQQLQQLQQFQHIPHKIIQQKSKQQLQQNPQQQLQQNSQQQLQQNPQQQLQQQTSLLTRVPTSQNNTQQQQIVQKYQQQKQQQQLKQQLKQQLQQQQLNKQQISSNVEVDSEGTMTQGDILNQMKRERETKQQQRFKPTTLPQKSLQAVQQQQQQRQQNNLLMQQKNKVSSLQQATFLQRPQQHSKNQQKPQIGHESSNNNKYNNMKILPSNKQQNKINNNNVAMVAQQTTFQPSSPYQNSLKMSVPNKPHPSKKELTFYNYFTDFPNYDLDLTQPLLKLQQRQNTLQYQHLLQKQNQKPLQLKKSKSQENLQSLPKLQPQQLQQQPQQPQQQPQQPQQQPQQLQQQPQQPQQQPQHLFQLQPLVPHKHKTTNRSTYIKYKNKDNKDVDVLKIHHIESPSQHSTENNNNQSTFGNSTNININNTSGSLLNNQPPSDNISNDSDYNHHKLFQQFSSFCNEKYRKCFPPIELPVAKINSYLSKDPSILPTPSPDTKDIKSYQIPAFSGGVDCCSYKGGGETHNTIQPPHESSLNDQEQTLKWI